MRTNIGRLAVTLSVLLAACGQQTPAPAAAFPEPAPALSLQRARSGDRPLLVVFHERVSPAALQAEVREAGGELGAVFGDTGVAVVRGTVAVRNALARSPAVMAVGAEQYHALPVTAWTPGGPLTVAPAAPNSDAGTFLQWYLRRIGAPQAASRVGEVLRGVTVGVIDTGVMSDHPDLSGQVTRSVNTAYCQEVGPDGTAGYPIYSQVADIYADPDWTPAAGCVDVPASYVSHGTMTAGIVAAKRGGGDLIGVAPGVALNVYKVFDLVRFPGPDGAPVTSLLFADGPLLQAITDAADRGVDILNLSLGFLVDRSSADGNAYWLAYKRVTNHAARKGTLIVAAAGNGALSSNGPRAVIPADLPAVMGVSASGVRSLGFDAAGQLVPTGPDVPAFYTNTGASVALAAPGGDCGTDSATGNSWCLVSPAQRPADWVAHQLLTTTITPSGQASYAWGMGTSGSAPMVVGVAALVKAQHPEYNANQLRAHLQRTAEKIGPQLIFGSGLVNADRATR